MFYELWISQRYLRSRQKEKFISLTAFISMIGIALGVTVLIVVIAVMSGFDKYLEDKMVGTNAHIIINFPAGMVESEGIIAKLKELESIVAISPFIAGQGIIRQNDQVLGVEFRGIDSKSQQEVTKLGGYLKKGSLELKGKELIIGQDLADRFNLRVGEQINLISPTTLKPNDFKIKGIFNSGMYLYDSSLVMTTLEAAEDFFKAANLTRGISIKINDVYKSEDVKRLIYRKLGNEYLYSVMSWMDMNQNFLSALKLEKTVMFIVVTMTTVVAAFGIVSTLIMSVMSKVKDIGILRSIGAKSKSILMIFLFKGLGVGFMGIILGLLGGISLALSLNNIIDFISKLIGRNLIPKDIYYFDRLPTNFNTADIILIVICAFVISLLASLYPAYQASRINLSEALRHE